MDETQRAQFEFDRATTELRKCLPGKPAFGIEAKYSQAYQWLVRLGAAPQIKLKYRRSTNG